MIDLTAYNVYFICYHRQVHREPLYRRYYATTFSGACCYSFAFGFILIVLPLIIAYNTSGNDDGDLKTLSFDDDNDCILHQHFLFSAFWLKDDVIYEQPSVTYRYYTIVELHGLRYAYS